MNHLFDRWVLDPIGLGLPVLAVLWYGWLLHRHRGAPWATWRTASWITGWVVFAWCAGGGTAAQMARLPWTGALGVAVASAVVPLLLAIADPVRLWESVRGRPAALLHNRLASVLMFPLVGTCIAAGVQLVAFVGPWYTTARTHMLAWDALLLAGLVMGLLVNLPLLTEDLLPAWCGPGLKTLFAAIDGLIDAVPGLAVAFGVDWNTGMALVCTAEAIGVPMVGAVLVQWMRLDALETREVDRLLDEREASLRGEAGHPQADADHHRPWWETDPRFADRFGPN